MSRALELAKDLIVPIEGFQEPTRLEKDSAKELRRLDQQEAALKEWFTKTDWVRPTLKPAELGKHIADVLKDRLATKEAQRDELLAALKGMLLQHGVNGGCGPSAMAREAIVNATKGQQ